MLKITNLKKSFKSKNVLKNIDLCVNQNELILLSGSNGCGKSTLFKVICDILSPDQGEIELDDTVYIGALIENPIFIENRNLSYNLKFLGSINHKYDITKIKELCELFKLSYDNKDCLSSYSVGMRQKVGIIQAVMENQNLILLDEPVRGLDKESIDSFVILVDSLIKEGKSVIIASHDCIDGMLFSRKLKIENGELEEV